MTALPRPPAHPAHFRQAMRVLASGIAIVTATDADGLPIGMTATSVTSFSMEPPSILFCANRSGSMAPHLEAGRAVGISILAGNQADIASAFAGMTGLRGADRFGRGDWMRGSLDVPILRGARCALECSIDEVIDRHTHRIVICLVHRVHPGKVDDPGLIADSGRMSSFSPPPPGSDAG